jgi:uncharacterized membrane protein
MPRQGRMLSDEKIHRIIGNLLRIGVTAAALVTLFGGILLILQHSESATDLHIFRGEPKDLRTLSGILRDAMNFQALGIIQFGLLLLVATPIARVVLSAVAFAIQRDFLYIGITLFVLFVLVFSIMGGTL